MDMPLAKFEVNGAIKRVLGGFNVGIFIRNLSSPVTDEEQIMVMAWMYLSGALKRRGCDLKKMVDRLP